MMNSQFDDFITELKGLPAFVAAASVDPAWSKHLDAIAFALNEIDRRADDDSRIVDVFDDVMAIITNDSVSLQ
jgi:hypothetical protein